MSQWCNSLLHEFPPGHNVRLLDLVKKPEERRSYATQAIRNGWSRNVLVIHIESVSSEPSKRAACSLKVRMLAGGLVGR